MNSVPAQMFASVFLFILASESVKHSILSFSSSITFVLGAKNTLKLPAFNALGK